MCTSPNDACLPIYRPPDLTGSQVTYREGEVTSHGLDHAYVYPGRRVVDVPGRAWPAARPEDCTDTSQTGEWLSEHVLVCRGCGLDAT